MGGSARAAVGSSDFWGREVEIGLISKVVDRCLGGELRTLILSGEPGIGKTRLAEECSRIAAGRGAAAFWARWREDEEYPEYWAWARLLGSLLDERPAMHRGAGLEPALSELSVILPGLRERFPELAAPFHANGGRRRTRLFDAVKRVVRHAAALEPLVFVLDNLHLAGEASTALLAEVLQELRDVRLLVVVTYRDVDADLTLPLKRFLAEVSLMDSVRRIDLHGLDGETVGVLAAHICGRSPDREMVREIERFTGGNPLFVHEAARLLCAEISSGRRERLWSIEIPHAINGFITRRFDRLSKGCKQLLRRGALIGRNFTFEEMKAVVREVSAKRFEECGREGVRNAFLTAERPGEEYRFVHEVIRRAILAGVPVFEQRRAAARLAARLEAQPETDDAARALKLAAWYAQIGGEEAEQAYRRYTRIAAQAALDSGAFESAAELFGRLLRGSRHDRGSLGDRAGEHRLPAAATEPPLDVRCRDDADAAFGLGRARFLAGDRVAAVRHFNAAFQWYKVCGDLQQMIAIATQPGYLQAGEPGFFDFYRELLPLLPEDSLLEARVLHFYGIAQFNSLGNYERAQVLLARAHDLAVRHRDPLLQKASLAALAFIDNTHDRLDEARAKVERALAIGRLHPDPFGDAHAWFVLSCTLRMSGQPGVASGYVDRAFECAQPLRDSDFAASFEHERAGIEILSGRWEEARRRIEDGLQACPEHLHLLAQRAFLEYSLGNFPVGDEYRRRILSIHERTPAGPYHAHIHAASTAAVRACNSGDRRELARWNAPLRSIASYGDAHPFIRLRAHLLLAFIAVQLEDAIGAREQYKIIEELPRLHLIRPYLTERFLGLAAHCFGDHTKAVAHLCRARSQATRYGDHPLGAWIAAELAEALLPRETLTGPCEEARRAFLEALETAETLGLEPLKERVEARLLRIEEGDAAARPLDLHLSRREREVLNLVGDGLSNDAVATRLEISPYTVVNHMRRIMAKTHTRNRTEAVHVGRSLGMIE